MTLTTTLKQPKYLPFVQCEYCGCGGKREREGEKKRGRVVGREGGREVVDIVIL